MGVDVSHLVLETSGDTNNQVVDDCLDGSKGCDVFAGTVVQFDVHNIICWVGEADSQMSHVLDQFALTCQFAAQSVALW